MIVLVQFHVGQIGVVVDPRAGVLRVGHHAAAAGGQGPVVAGRRARAGKHLAAGRLGGALVPVLALKPQQLIAMRASGRGAGRRNGGGDGRIRIDLG